MELEPEWFARLRDAAAERCADADPAHDVLHVLRVASTASVLARAERADGRIAVAAALTHELVNLPKDHAESHRSGELCADAARALFHAIAFPRDRIDPVCDAIRDHAFSAGRVPHTLEGKILQDADRLDAIGAIGIARCFATCASMRRPFYDPDDPFCRVREPDDKRWGLDHFYRKLLKIPERLHTEHARAMARPRLAAMNAYLASLETELVGASSR